MTELYNSDAWPIFEMIVLVGVASIITVLIVEAIGNMVDNYRSNKKIES